MTVVGGKTSYRDILEHNGGAVILAVKEDGRILMVRQFRKALEREVLELPAGKIDGDEDPMDTALRELKEETGYQAGSIRHLTTISPSCGYTTELLYIYLCKDLTPGETHFDDTEDLDLYEYTADELVDRIMKGEIQEKLPGWNVVVGPTEAVQLPKYMKDKEYEAAAKAAAAENAAKAATTVEVKELSFDELLATKVPEIKVVDMGVKYKGYNPESQTFVTIGERIHCIAPSVRKAMDERDPEPILKRAAEQIKAGATYLDVNIGPAESNGPELMTWAVKLLQENFNNVPLALDTANKRAIEAGIKVYNRTNGKPIVNSADAGSRISYIDLAAANDAICIALCSADGIAKDNEERMMHCHHMLERGLSLGMEATDLWFDPLFLVVKGMQDKQMDVLNAIKLFSDEGLKSTGGLSNNSNGAPKNVRPIMDSALVAMAMMQGLTSAIVNPNDLRLMETIKSCDIFKNNELYSDSYLDA